MLESGSVLIPNSFASGLYRHYRHFENFRQTKGSPEHMLVEVRLADGHTFVCNGLWISHLDQVGGCVMVHGTPAQSENALVIREDHIVSAILSVKSPSGDERRQPFGFAAGSSAEI